MTADTICFGACLALLAALLVRLVAAGHHRRIEAGGEPQPQPHQEPPLYWLGQDDREYIDPGIVTGHTTLPPAEHGVAAGGYEYRGPKWSPTTRVEVISPHDAPAETWGCEWGVDDHGDAKAPPEPLFRL